MYKAKRCDGIIRRDMIRIGGLSALGLGLGDYFRLRASRAAESRHANSAKSCILIWLDGGPSHFETFDPKPDAPQEVRGPLGTVATNIPGVHLSECLQRTAKVMDKIAIIRSMTSPLGEHNFGTHYLMTGYKPSPALEYPMWGATLAQLHSSEHVLPPNIALHGFSRTLRGNGFLPAATAPFTVSVEGRANSGNFKVRDLDLYRGLDLARLDRRRAILQALDDFSRTKDASAETSDPNLERAYNLITSVDAKAAFNLSDEPVEVRNRYGRGTKNSIGQACLLARRLIERDVPFVTVNNVGWDTHNNINKLKAEFPGDKNALLPSLDRALSALIGDLSERGMLNETLVVVMGEFGRTPKINALSGRDHWPNCFSVALAGGGIQGGQTIGHSDALGEFPSDNPVTPADLAATVFTLLGVDPGGELHTSDGRPVRITPDGAKVVKQLMS